jgi:hypothetical protein
MEEEIEESGPGGATGSAANLLDFKIIKYPFGKYEVTLKLLPNNEFLDVLEIRINKDFMSSTKEAQPKGFHDVDEFYPEK